MNQSEELSTRRLRHTVYFLLIVLSGSMMIGRIMAVDSVDTTKLEAYRIREAVEQRRQKLQQRGVEAAKIEADLTNLRARLRDEKRITRPFLSANDRSRWCMIRALVEPQMRVPGAPYAIDRVIQEPTWDTIDMVKHDGHLYSSKPPLLPTLMAIPYWLIYQTTGATLGDHPYVIGRSLLVLFNVLPLALAWLLLATLVERFGATDWGRMLVMGAATLGTFLATFAVVLNNHLPAVVAIAVTLYALVRIWIDGRTETRYFVIAGTFAALSVVCELPAAALAAAVAVGLLWRYPKQTLTGFAPAAVLVAAGFFGTNWIAHQSLEPPYAHRSAEDNWYDYTYERNGREIESYWRNRVGIDRGEPSRAVYALHTLVGHHGIFSLTPLWILSFIGMGMWMRRRDQPRLAQLAGLVSFVSLVVIVFYLLRSQDDRNYGGMTSGFRWVFWLAPLWLWTMLPAADWMSHRPWRRGLAWLMLGVGAFSAAYPTWNPWTHPWLVNLMQYLGWIEI